MKTYIMLILVRLRFFVLSFLQRIKNFWYDNGEEDMHQAGELLVTGNGEAKIDLKTHPVSVKVFFDGDPVIVPCNPHHHDHLHWHIRSVHHNHRHDHRHDHCKH